MKMLEWALLGCLVMTFPPEMVKRVKDGDTFVLYSVNIDGEENVRVISDDGFYLDTPERGHPKAAEATAFTKQWLSLGPAELKACKRDSFGRYLGYVQRNGESLDMGLRKAGLIK